MDPINTVTLSLRDYKEIAGKAANWDLLIDKSAPLYYLTKVNAYGRSCVNTHIGLQVINETEVIKELKKEIDTLTAELFEANSKALELKYKKRRWFL